MAPLPVRPDAGKHGAAKAGVGPKGAPSQPCTVGSVNPGALRRFSLPCAKHGSMVCTKASMAILHEDQTVCVNGLTVPRCSHPSRPWLLPPFTRRGQRFVRRSPLHRAGKSRFGGFLLRACVIRTWLARRFVPRWSSRWRVTNSNSSWLAAAGPVLSPKLRHVHGRTRELLPLHCGTPICACLRHATRQRLSAQTFWPRQDLRIGADAVPQAGGGSRLCASAQCDRFPAAGALQGRRLFKRQL
jgi:hypothetical protein